MVTAVVAVLVVAGCGTQPVGRKGSVASTFDPAVVNAAARTVLATWTAAHATDGPTTLVATGDLVTQVGDWMSGADPGGHKLAYVDGLIEVAGDVTGSDATVGAVRWSDGSSVAVPTLAVSAAVRQDAPPRTSSGTTVAPLVVVAATATTTTLATTRGPAIVPAWDLTLADTTVHLTAVSVSATVPEAAGTPGRDLPGVGSGTVAVDGVTVGPDGRTLTVRFTGAPDDARTFCGEDYTAQTVANADAVVLTVVRHGYSGPAPSPPPGSDAVGCALVGAERQAVTALDAPLAGRPVLDLVTARPVPVS